MAGCFWFEKYLFLGICRYFLNSDLCKRNQKHKHMENLNLTLLIVSMLLEDANREQCLKVLDCPDGDLRAHAQARLRVLDKIQADAQATIYRETPPGMVLGFEVRDWWYENKGGDNMHHIDFNRIADNKKMEWYAYMDAETSRIL